MVADRAFPTVHMLHRAYITSPRLQARRRVPGGGSEGRRRRSLRAGWRLPAQDGPSLLCRYVWPRRPLRLLTGGAPGRRGCGSMHRCRASARFSSVGDSLRYRFRVTSTSRARTSGASTAATRAAAGHRNGGPADCSRSITDRNGRVFATAAIRLRTSEPPELARDDAPADLPAPRLIQRFR